MAKSITDLKVDLQGALHGTNLNKVQAIDQVIYRAAGDLLLDIDPKETQRTDSLTGGTYDSSDDTYTYTDLPEDLKGRKVTYLAPSGSNTSLDNYRARYSKEFDLRRERNTFTIDIDGTTKTLRLSTGSTATTWEIAYYSKYLFRDATSGDWQETVTDDSNLINLDTESYNLLFDKVMILLAPQLQGKDSAFDLAFYQNEYKTARARYVAQNKSEAQSPQTFYYRQPFGPTRSY
jgi:hypothetical protein